MNLVKTTSFPSETRSIKTENRLLWIALLAAACIIAVQASAYERLKSSITAQAVYDACNNKEQSNVRK